MFYNHYNDYNDYKGVIVILDSEKKLHQINIRVDEKMMNDIRDYIIIQQEKRVYLTVADVVRNCISKCIKWKGDCVIWRMKPIIRELHFYWILKNMRNCQTMLGETKWVCQNISES